MSREKQLPPLYQCVTCKVWSSRTNECNNCGAKRTGKEKKI